MRSCQVYVLVAALSVVGTGCCRAISKGNVTAEDGGGGATPAATATDEQSQATAPATPAEDFFESASLRSLFGKFNTKLGTPVLVMQLVIYPNYAVLEVQDRNKLENVDRYTYINGELGNRGPEQVHETAAQLSKRAFHLDEIPVDRIAEFIQRAVKEVGVEDAKATHVIVEKDNSKTIIRVYAGSDRRSGYVEFDTGGKIVRKSKG